MLVVFNDSNDSLHGFGLLKFGEQTKETKYYNKSRRLDWDQHLVVMGRLACPSEP